MSVKKLDGPKLKTCINLGQLPFTSLSFPVCIEEPLPSRIVSEQSA